MAVLFNLNWNHRSNDSMPTSEEVEAELVKSVVDFTGAAPDRARKLLQESEWNVPEAVTRFFLAVDATPALNQPARREPVALQPLLHHPTPLWGLRTIFNTLIVSIKSCMGWAAYSCWRACSLFLFGSPPGLTTGSGNLAPYFESLPEGPCRPVSLECSFNEAATRTRQRDNRKVLLIYLDSASSPEFPTTVRNVLCEESVASVINGQFAFWAGDVDYAPPAHLLRAFPVRGVPLLIAVVSVNSTELKIVAACSGRAQFTVPGVVAVLQKAQEQQDRLMAEDYQLAVNRTLRQDQDQEYEEALARDRALAEERERIESEAAKKAEVKNDRKANTEQERARLVSKFRDAPQPLNPTTIVVRLHDGVRIERKFEKTSTVTTLHEWVLCCGELHPQAVGAAKKIHSGNFSLSTSYPSKRLDEMSATLEEAGLVPNAVLVVSLLDDGSDSE